MAGNNCPNCGTCPCTGAYPVKAKDGKQCCSHCINTYNNYLIRTKQVNYPPTPKAMGWASGVNTLTNVNSSS